MAEKQGRKKVSCSCNEIVISSIGEPKTKKKTKPKKTIKTHVKSLLIRSWRKISFGIRNSFAEFCYNSSIHGIRHFCQQAWYEKLFFFILIGISIVACTLIVQLIRFEWLDKPVILSYDIKSMTVEEIPFPAITICPQARASHKRFDCKKDRLNFMANFIVDQDL